MQLKFREKCRFIYLFFVQVVTSLNKGGAPTIWIQTMCFIIFYWLQCHWLSLLYCSNCIVSYLILTLMCSE